jgi:hypothetical protein
MSGVAGIKCHRGHRAVGRAKKESKVPNGVGNLVWGDAGAASGWWA